MSFAPNNQENRANRAIPVTPTASTGSLMECKKERRELKTESRGRRSQGSATIFVQTASQMKVLPAKTSLFFVSWFLLSRKMEPAKR